MTEKVPGMNAKALQELLDRHNLSDAEGRYVDGLHAAIQEAYGLGWADSENRPTPQELLEELLRDNSRLSIALDRLTPEERTVAELRFGLVDEGIGRAPTLEMVGKKLGVSRERVRQLEGSAINKMLAE
jgi:RNA polymerase primary sigma factor